MLDKNYQRARTAARKQERLQDLMNAADHQFSQMPYHEITLSTIAAETGWSRGNVYKYVSTKEEIFLLLYLEKQAAFIEEAAEALKDIEDIAAAAEKIGALLEKHIGYLKYHDILSGIIETNVSMEKLAEFKKNSYQEREKMFVVLRRLCPECTDTQIIQIYLTLLYEGCGLMEHFNASEMVLKAMKAAGVPERTEEHFAVMMGEFTEIILRYYRPGNRQKQIQK